MALQDPENPPEIDPGIAAALAAQQDPGVPWWASPDWQINTPDYGQTSSTLPPGPLPPPQPAPVPPGVPLTHAPQSPYTNPFPGMGQPVVPLPPIVPLPAPKQVGPMPGAQTETRADSNAAAPPVEPPLSSNWLPTGVIDQGIANLPNMPHSAPEMAPDENDMRGMAGMPTQSPFASHELADPLATSAAGGVVVPPTPADVGAAFAPAPPAGHPSDAMTPSGFTDEVTKPELAGPALADLARDQPDRYAAYVGAAKADAATAALKARTQANLADQQWLERNMAARADAKARADARSAQVDAEAKNMTADGGFWDSRSGGQVVAAYIAAMLGGIQSVNTGRPNEGLAMINQAIERHIQFQKAKLADGRGEVARMYQRMGDDFAADEVMRQAIGKQVEDRLLTEQQNFDPRGTKSRMIADEIVKSRANRAEQAMKFNATMQKQLEEQAKQKLERDRLDESRRHAQQEERTANYNASIAAKRAETDRVQSVAQYGKGGLEDRKTTVEEQKAALAAAKGDPEKEKLLLERGVFELNDKGEVVPIMTKDPKTGKSTEFLIKGEGRQVNEFATKKTGTDRSIELIDQIINRGPAWMSDLKNSDKLNQMKGDTAALQLELMEAYNVKSITELHLEMLEKLAKDPTGVKDPTALLKETRANLVARMNGEYERQGIGKPYAPPKTDVKDPTPTSSDQQINAVIKGDWKDNREAINSMYGLAITSPDPNVRDANMTALKKIAEEATDKETRDTAKQWAAGAAARQPAPEWKPGSEIVTTDRSGPTVTVKFTDGTYKQMPTAEAIKVTTGPGGG